MFLYLHERTMCYSGAAFFIRKLDVNILEETIDFKPTDSGIYHMVILCYHSPVIVAEIIIRLKRAFKKLKITQCFRKRQEKTKRCFLRSQDLICFEHTKPNKTFYFILTKKNDDNFHK